MSIPIENQKGFIADYEKIRPDYIEFAKLLDSILTRAAEKFGFLALVQSRAKTVSSFAGKIISKDKYLDPLTELTDLCGARVIVHFHSHVEKICSFIKDNFEIDEANSLDAKSRLNVNEFGYRSIHYIVTPKKDFILDIPVDEKFKNKKAEIQVRTLAEHVWADISHDRIYKTNLNIPEDWRRQAARLSAILEDADNDFSTMARDIDSLSRVYELQYERTKADKEIEKLKSLIIALASNVDECARNVLRLSNVYRVMDKCAEAGEMLKSWLDKPINPLTNVKLWFEYGMVLTLSNCLNFRSQGYSHGIKAIKHSLKLMDGLPIDIKKDSEEEMSYIFYRYGKLLQQNEEEQEEMHKYFSNAHHIMPDNPLYLVALMESVVLRNTDMAKYSVGLFKASIDEAIPKLKKLVEIGIKKVPALFAIGRCQFLSGNRSACIMTYAHAAETILNNDYLTSLTVVTDEIALAGRLKRFDAELATQIQLFLNIVLYLSANNPEKENSKNYLEIFNIRKEPFKTPVVIVAGGASLMDESKANDYRDYIRELMHNFNGTLISGGTTAGIPGMVGQVKAEMQKQAPVDFELIAYLPENMPDNAVKSSAYDRFYKTDSGDFSALDILVCWADLINDGINPADVILIGIDGGEIATLEYRIALSLGAKVGLVLNSGRAVSNFLQEKTWKNHPNLLQLPKDPLTVWALVNQTSETILTQEEIETLAPLVHEFYRLTRLEELIPEANDINKFKVLMPWNKLDPSLRHSNLKQVAFYEHILNRVDLSIRKKDNPVPFNIKENVNQAEYDMLAKLEHARWNAERLLEGWKYGPDKDIAAKLNPCITAWENLDDETKGYDYGPVDNIPTLLSKIGYEVYKTS